MQTISRSPFSLIRGALEGIKPEPRITVSEWADKNRYLDSKSAAEPGLYRTSRTPYVREIADQLSVTSIVRNVVVMKGAQVGLTELGNNWIGYIIDCAPGPILAVQPTDAMVERNSKMRIAPMIEQCPTLRKKIKPNTTKNSGNTLTQKEFPGGVLIMASGNSATGLRSMPARFVMADETDAYPGDVDGEGSPLSLMEKRTSTFSNKKFLKISTPTISGESIIEAEFLLTDQRYFFVPCPHCGTFQYLKFEQLRWTRGQYFETYYECEHCNEAIQERYKAQMLAAGQWIATVPENENIYTVGYHVSALYSPPGWKSWSEIAEEWDKAQGDENKIKSFNNTVLGITHKLKTEAPAWEMLYNRAEEYQLNKVFKDVAVITCGIDVQADRVEFEIVGWMYGRRSQQIDYRVLMGDTAKTEIWLELDKVVHETFEREDGVFLPIRLIAIDSGYNSSQVYNWAKKHGYSKVVPIKGKENLEQFFSPPRAIDPTKHGKKIGKQKVWHVGVNYIKNETYGFFRQSIDPETKFVPEGYCYFPKRDPHYFRGLTAEVIQLQRTPRGFNKHVWVKKYERNEPLDCRVYARAASAILGIDNWKLSRWQREGQIYHDLNLQPTATTQTTANQDPQKEASQDQQSEVSPDPQTIQDQPTAAPQVPHIQRDKKNKIKKQRSNSNSFWGR